MRVRWVSLVWAAACLLAAAVASAGEVKFSAKEPVLLTSAGQSADVQMVKVLLDRNKISAKTSPLAGPDELQGHKGTSINLLLSRFAECLDGTLCWATEELHILMPVPHAGLTHAKAPRAPRKD